LTVGGVLGGLNAWQGYNARSQQRKQFNDMAEAERVNRQMLQQQKENLRQDTRAGMTDAMIAGITDVTGKAPMFKSMYDSTSAMGRQGMLGYDKDISNSVLKEQQILAQKPKAYSGIDFLSDFIGGGIQGYQTADSYQQNQMSRDEAKIDRDVMRKWRESWQQGVEGSWNKGNLFPTYDRQSFKDFNPLDSGVNYGI
jgi:hypothetical protein